MRRTRSTYNGCSQNRSQNESALSQSNREDNSNSKQFIQSGVDQLVRFLVIRAGENVPIKKHELKKILPNQGAHFQDIITQAALVLKKVYGYNLIAADNSYIVSNSLPYLESDVGEDIPEELPEGVHKILLLLTLSHIFMTMKAVSEDSLFSFLKELTIDVKVNHKVFGDVKNLLMVTFKNQGYLNIEVDKDTKKASFAWGLRAEKEVSKLSILKFVCKTYKHDRIEDWRDQFGMASDQEVNHMERFPDETDKT